MRRFMQEFGLVLFLAGAGMEGGGALAETLALHGGLPLLLGAGVTLCPLLVAWPVARGLGLDPLQALGGICGAMTSTPALGALVEQSTSPVPVRSYVTAYPAALVMLIAGARLLVHLLGGMG